MSVKRLDRVTLPALLEGGTPLVVEFSAAASPRPSLRAAAEAREDVTWGQVNVKTEAALAKTYGVQTTPAVLVFQSGKEAARLEGDVTEKDLLTLL
jgi:thioredoxin-like negative regulator of GroEL